MLFQGIALALLSALQLAEVCAESPVHHGHQGHHGQQQGSLSSKPKGVKSSHSERPRRAAGWLKPGEVCKRSKECAEHLKCHKTDHKCWMPPALDSQPLDQGKRDNDTPTTVELYGNCSEGKTCSAGGTCVYKEKGYSQCLPQAPSTTAPVGSGSSSPGSSDGNVKTPGPSTGSVGAGEGEGAKQEGFISVKDTHFVKNGVLFRFHSFNSPELTHGSPDTKFQVIDTFRTLSMKGSLGKAITRITSLEITSLNVKSGHIQGWNGNDWNWNEVRMQMLDFVYDEARKHGVYLIAPLINQDYGGENMNWMGHTTDLIRMRKSLSYDDARKVNFFTDREMIDSYKLIQNTLLNRKNTISGIRYGDDPTIMAWETGNEFSIKGYLPIPSSWTREVAQNFKRLAPNTLVLDGSYAGNCCTKQTWENEILDDKNVDIFQYHYYGDVSMDRVKADIELARSHGKTWIAGEYGILTSNSAKDNSLYKTFLQTVEDAQGGGTMIWSLRPHSSQGGFVTHEEEPKGTFSYHASASQKTVDQFDALEASVVTNIREYSFTCNGEQVPGFPIPYPVGKVWKTKDSHHISFQGSAWADKYTITAKNKSSGESRSMSVEDYIKAGNFEVDISQVVAGIPNDQLTIDVQAIGMQGVVDMNGAKALDFTQSLLGSK